MHAHFATQHACATFAETSQLLGDATKNGCNLDAGYARPCTGKYAVGVIKSAVCMNPARKKTYHFLGPGHAPAQMRARSR